MYVAGSQLSLIPYTATPRLSAIMGLGALAEAFFSSRHVSASEPQLSGRLSLHSSAILQNGAS